MASPASADSKFLGFFWGFSHWKSQDFQPYINDSKILQNNQWANDKWRPQDWVKEKGSVQNVMKGFEENQIITDQYVDDEVPVLEVGQRFMSLSDQEKRRIAAFVDYAFGVTEVASVKMFRIKLINKRDPIGIYTKEGLQL